MIIGFDPEEYVVYEMDGSITLMVRLFSGVLEREILVDFKTAPHTATSIGTLKQYYTSQFTVAGADLGGGGGFLGLQPPQMLKVPTYK